ncbi:Gcd10p family-domain-containing protein [Chytriomyces sp. MP71]|nr:Gcd10p family-domain-containing protein [Chytriomyces sp. MP71]
MMMAMKEGDHVLVKMPSHNLKIVHLKTAATKVNLGKFGSFQAGELFGKPWNAVYNIEADGTVEAVVDPNQSVVDFAVDAEAAANNNNSQLLDLGQVQQATTKAIIEEKRAELAQGAIKPEDIVKTLVSTSQTFETKTVFAQQKYIRRKERKFSRKFEALEPSARNLCEYYFTTKPQKTRGLRIDTLSQMLCLANVTASSTLLLGDSVGGLLVGAVLERLTDGTRDLGGRILALQDSDTNNHDLLKEMNFPSEVLDRVINSLPWSRVDPAEHEINPPAAPETTDTTLLSRHTRKLASIAHTNAVRGTYLGPDSADALLLATQWDPLEALQKLLPFLGYSRSVVVYSAHRETLAETYLFLRGSKEFVNAQLSETMTREYQVPVSGLGTHPFMQTSGTGGFILTATKVDAGGCPEAAVYGNRHVQPTKRRKL